MEITDIKNIINLKISKKIEIISYLLYFFNNAIKTVFLLI